MSLASPSRCGSVLSWHEVHPTLLCLSYIAMVSGHVPRVLKPRFFLSRSKKQSLGTMWMWDVYNMYPPLLCDKPQWHIRGRGLCSCGHTRCNHGRCRRVCVSSVPALLFLPRSAVWGRGCCSVEGSWVRVLEKCWSLWRKVIMVFMSLWSQAVMTSVEQADANLRGAKGCWYLWAIRCRLLWFKMVIFLWRKRDGLCIVILMLISLEPNSAALYGWRWWWFLWSDMMLVSMEQKDAGLHGAGWC